jgi:cathepsin B
MNLGCGGGYLTKSLDFIAKQGLTTLDCFPFEGIEKYENCTELLAECPLYKI